MIEHALHIELLQLLDNKVHHNVWLHISFLIFYGSLIGYIILLPLEVLVLWLVTKILFAAEAVLCSQSEYQRIREMVSFWWTSFPSCYWSIIGSQIQTQRGHIILLLQGVALWLVTKILFSAEAVLCSQSEYQRIREMVSFWRTSFPSCYHGR